MITVFLILSCLVLFYFLVQIYGESFLLFFAVITLLATPAEAVTFLRPVIQLTDFAILFYIFIKEYGVDFKKYPVVPRNLVYLLIFLFFVLILSVTFSNFPSLGYIAIFRTAAFFLLVYLFYGVIRTQKQIDIILKAFFFAGLILMGSVVVDFLIQGRGLLYLLMPIRDRNYGLYSNFNVTGVYAILISPLVILAFFSNRYRNRRIILIASAVIILASVVLIASRAALAGVVLGSVIILFFLNRKLFISITAVILLILAVHIVFNPFGPSIDVALRMEEGLSQHDQFWKLAVNMFTDNPILGIGPGNYPKEEFNYIPVMLNSFAGETMITIHNQTGENGSNNSHNFYLVMASDMGILGLIFAFTLLITFFRMAYQTFNKYKHRNREVYLILVGIISIGICLTLRGMVESNSIFYYGNISSDLPFWLFFVILISYHRNRYKILPEEEKSPALKDDLH